jgi:sodium ion-translocating decarboxylase beta subunit
MDFSKLLSLFPGIEVLFYSPLWVTIARLGLVILGMALVYLGRKGVLEPLLMIPMGFGMVAVNAGVLLLPGNRPGTLFLEPMTSETNALMNVLQIDFLQPIYTFMFSNGLIACLVFLGIGILLDVGYVLARPFESMFLALCAELGTVATFPLAVALGLTPGQSAAIAMVGGADGPMVLYTSLMLARDLFVPITVVAYLYLGLTYGGYPYLVKLLVPAHIRAIKMTPVPVADVSSEKKLAFALVACALLCFLLPVASPLFLSLFVGVAVRESGITAYIKVIGDVILYASTFFLGLVLGVLCEAGTIFSSEVFVLLILGITALLLSGIGGILGGYALYYIKKGNYNPVIGIAAVSCVPTTAKVAQKIVSEEAPDNIILPEALGANICGVITTAVLTGVYVSVVNLWGGG